MRNPVVTATSSDTIRITADCGLTWWADIHQHGERVAIATVIDKRDEHAATCKTCKRHGTQLVGAHNKGNAVVFMTAAAARFADKFAKEGDR